MLNEMNVYSIQNRDFAGPHYLAYEHVHIRATNGEIVCLYRVYFSYTKNWLLKLQSGLKKFGYKSVLGHISLDHLIPDHRPEIPITNHITIDELRAIGFFGGES